MPDNPTNDGPTANDEDGPPVLSRERAADCLERARRGVLDVLIGTAVVIAVGGWLLRGHVPTADRQQLRFYHYLSFSLLLALTIASRWAWRTGRRRAREAAPERRPSVFVRSHRISAALGGLAAPLGIFHGWFASADASEVAPFWIVAIVLGTLAFPRARELADLDPTSATPSQGGTDA